MTVFQWLRSAVVLCLIPVMTFVVSVLAILSSGLLGASARRLQIFPRWWGRIIVRASGVSVTIEGLDKLAQDATYIFAANHQSQFDIFALQGFLDFDFRWLAKKELFSIPIFGAGMRRAGYIAVDRSHGRQAMKSLDEAAQRIAAGTSVIIFPEGTRSPDGRLGQFKPGAMVLAIKASVPLVPLAIKGSHAILPKGRLLPKPGHILIRIGEPIATAGFHIKQKQELATRLQEAVARLLEKG